MRIGRLDLLRYGRFTNVSIELPCQNPDFQVVFGQNEAGKSTALTAIGDLLFSIPHPAQLAAQLHPRLCQHANRCGLGAR